MEWKTHQSECGACVWTELISYDIKYTELIRNLIKDPGETSIGINPLVIFETGGFKFMVQQFLSRFNSKLKD